jgi:hypothetical protein
MESNRTVAGMAWDVLRGLILGALLSYGVLRIVQVSSDSIIFRYAGY